METRDPAFHRPATLNIEEAARDSLSVHWRAVFAGLFVSFLIFLMCMSLGLAFGSSAIREVLQADDAIHAVAIGAGVWMLVSAIVALFLGSYASSRVSGIIATRVGYTQGAVITALFFLALIVQLGMSVDIAARAVMNLSVGAISSTINGLANNAQLRGVVEDNIADLWKPGINRPLPTVPIVARLIRGDRESAVRFMAGQMNVPIKIARARVDTMVDQFRIVQAEVADRAASTATRFGLTMFVTIVLGTFSAMLGGGTGALVNLRKPLDRVDERALNAPAFST